MDTDAHSGTLVERDARWLNHFDEDDSDFRIEMSRRVCAEEEMGGDPEEQKTSKIV